MPLPLATMLLHSRLGQKLVPLDNLHFLRVYKVLILLRCRTQARLDFNQAASRAFGGIKGEREVGFETRLK